MFLHQCLLVSVPAQALGSDPDVENFDIDKPSLVEEAFEQPKLVEVLRQSAQGLSGEHQLCMI